ncbi:MAG: hypothetical protein ABIO55_09310, partial [Ginsengibacter sp.]
KKIKLGTEKFMIWAGSNELSNISLKEITDKTLTSGLIHWAGCLQYTYVTKMVGGDILKFFEDYYYSRIKMGNIFKIFRKLVSGPEYYLKQLYYNLKPAKWLKRISKERIG